MPRQNSQNHSEVTPLLQKKRSKKELPSINKQKREHIVLLSKDKVKSFKVFLDQEVGLPFKYEEFLNETNGDEDYQSSDEVIQDGISKCQELLAEGLTQITKQDEHSSSSTSTVSKCQVRSPHKNQRQANKLNL